MLHTYSAGWGQERQRVTAHIFHVLFPVGIWPLKNRARKVRLLCKMCANLKWLNFAKNVSLFSQSCAKHFAMRGISGMVRSNCLALCFCRTFYKTIPNFAQKDLFSPGPARLCRFDVSWQLVRDDGCQYFWLEGMLTIWLVQSDMERHRAEENRVQLILIRDGDNWLITGSERKDQQFRGKITSLTASFLRVLGNASGECSSHSSGASSYPQLFRFHGSLFWQPFMQTRNYQRIKDDFMTGEM